MRSTDRRVAAIDLGATSGRVMAGVVGPDRLELDEAHRFANGGVRIGDSLHWDVLGIYRESLAGLRTIAGVGPLHGIGIDSWAIDYGLLDRAGTLLGNPYTYRDPRTAGVAERVAESLDSGELYAVTGLQRLPFNTIYQLVAEAGSARRELAKTLLLLPDLLAYWLTGEVGAERTNASTTGLYDARAREWAKDVAIRIGLPADLLPPLRDAGSEIGALRPTVATDLGVSDAVPVIAVGSHDTASAVVAVPTATESFAYISSGTWSLVGLELDRPVLTGAARVADFTNEGGVDGTIRFLKNVMGLWVLAECVRSWDERAVPGTDLASLLDAASRVDGLRTVVDINDASLLAPSTSTDPMPDRILALARSTGEPSPESPAQVARCVLDSLALAYVRHLRTAAELSGRGFDVVHVVGGGSQNALLCQLTADALGVPVLAGPTEAAAIGNVLVQARTLGVDLPDLAAMRALVRRTHAVRRHDPRSGLDWDSAQVRVTGGGG
ncbi:rhamnulokinase [Solicola gregarius]|uniref:Rhamnulokinase n=1 Tax=Solicola gregarius TaxID=2908642 RepID=A0AA46TEF9_9ACTN|nr:rhamnulokinase family protein [Solicola gregarius]UYM03349.1 rhamnulokinase [Solicola gregarius]